MGLLSRHSSILRTGLILIGFPIAFQLASLGFLLKVQNDAQDAQQLEIHSRDVLSRVATLQLKLDQAHAAIRGTAIYADAGFERDRREAIAAWPDLLTALRRLVADNPGQQAHLDRTRDASQPYLDWYRSMERLAAAGEWDAVRAELLTARGKTLLEGVQRELDTFTREEMRLARVRVDFAAAARSRERTVLFAAALLTAALAVGLLVFFTGGLSRRLAQVAVNSRRLATGESLLPSLPGADEVASLDAVLHDSARRLAEAAAAEKRYASELEARGHALEQANRDLLFKTQENEMFVYSVSHDLRSPLVNVQGFTKELAHGCEALQAAMAADGTSEAGRERVHEILHTDILESVTFIQAATTRLSAIVDALLRLSRAGRVEFSRQRVDLGPIVERIVRAMRSTVDERGAEVTVGRLPAVTGDPAAIEQVFANLIGNALNYLDPQRPGRVHVGTGADGGGGDDSSTTVFVRDNGLGIPSRYLPKLFVPFERLHGNKVKGEGIGLALARRVVERQGGRIWAESVEHEGTTFYVALPREQAGADGARRAAPLA